MRERILEEPARVERERGVVVLYAAESGSRAWGFPSRDSDWDVRFVYAHPRDWYLSIVEGRDVIEQPIDDGLDLSGWDLRKALRLFRMGNAALSEWLRSPTVYVERGTLAARLRTMVPQVTRLRSCLEHYRAMAKKNYRDYLRGERVRTKKYFYVLRPILACRWLLDGRGVPPMEFAELLGAVGVDATVRPAIDDLLVRKTTGEEMDDGPRIAVLNRFIEEALGGIAAGAADLPASEQVSRDTLDALFREILAGLETA
jgi:predicted nucleotidyltransferase